MKKDGVKFSTAFPKSDVDWKCYRASRIPAPNQYGNLADKAGNWEKGRVKWSDSNPKSDLDWKIYRSNQIPAPGQYGAPDLPKKQGVKFSTAYPKSEIEWVEYNAAQVPGPYDYDVQGGYQPSTDPDGSRARVDQGRLMRRMRSEGRLPPPKLVGRPPRG